MAVLEAGIILNGLPLLRREYYQSSGDSTLKAGFFEALNQFAQTLFPDDSNEESLQEYHIGKQLVLFIRVTLKSGQQPLIYIICEKNNEVPVIEKILKRIVIMVKEKINSLSEGIIPDYEEKYAYIFDDNFKDLKIKKSERISRLF